MNKLSMANKAAMNMCFFRIALILILVVLCSCFSTHHPLMLEHPCQKYADEGDEFFSYSDCENAVIKYELAAECFRQNSDSKELMAALTGMINAYQRLKQYRKVIEKAEELAAIAHEHPDALSELNALMFLGKAYFRTAEYMKAIFSYERASDIASANGDTLLFGMIQGNIANVRLELGDYFSAIDLYQKALETAADKKQYAAFLGNLGAAYMSIGDYHTASEHYQKAVHIAKNQNELKMAADFLMNLGNLCFKADHLFEKPKADKPYESTVEYYQSALSIAKDIGDASIIKTATVNLGMVSIIQNNMSEAEKYLKDADFLRRSILYLHREPPEHEKAIETIQAHLSEVEQSMDTDSIFGCYMTLGLALEKAERFSEAAGYFRTLIKRIEDEREMVSESQKVHFFEAKPYFVWNRLAPYEGMIRIMHDDESFYYSEAIKSRLFMEQTARKYQDRLSSKWFKIPAAVRKKELLINNRLAELHKKKSSVADADMLIQINSDISQLKEQRKALVDGLRKASLDECDEYCPQYAAIQYPQPFDLTQIKTEPDEVIIEYAVTETAAYAWLIRDHQIKMQIKINISKNNLSFLITDYIESLKNFEKIPKKEDDDKNMHMLEMSHLLYRLLLQHFDPLIGENRIIIIPDKQLGLLPFETLAISYSEENPFVKTKYPNSNSIIYYRPNAEYFGDKYKITYFQSAGAMSQSRMLSYKAAAPKTILSVADPAFKPSKPRLEHIEKLMSDFSSLPETLTLNQSLKQTFNHEASRFLTGSDANETVFKQTLKSNPFDLIVIATHGILKNDFPTLMEPALILSQTSPSEEDDILQLSEVMNLSLDTKLVALIACSSGVGKLISGEGVMNLGRAFQYAGARAALMSLWNVAVDPSVLLAEKFFYYLRSEKDNAEALRLARTDVRNAGYDHPFFWAPFVLYGQNY